MAEEQKIQKVIKKGIARKYDDSKNKTNYSSKSLPYDKRNIAMNSQSQVSKFRKHYKDISPDAQMIVDQIIDPAMQNATVLLPTYGVGCMYTANNILSAKYDQNGDSIVLTYPSLKESIYYTSGENVVTTITAAGGINNPYLKQKCSLRRDVSLLPFVTPFNFEGGRVALSKPSLKSGLYLYGMRPATSPNNDIQVKAVIADNHDSANIKMTVVRLDSNENIISSSAATAFNNGVCDITLFGSVLGIEWVAFYLTLSGSTIPFDSDISLQLVAVQSAPPAPADGVLNLPNVYTNCLTQNVNESTTITQSAESYFISAQSTLLTYEGSELKSTGRCAIARVPAASWAGQLGGQSFVPNADSYYQWIASLSRNTYNGSIKHGGYAFYLGEDERNYFYRQVEESYSPELPYVIAAFSTDPTDPQDVRIQVTSIIQFTTNSNIYNQSPSPYLGEDWCKLLHILSCINAAYDNAGHREKLKAALKKVGNKVIGLLKDPKTYATVGSIIAGLL